METPDVYRAISDVTKAIGKAGIAKDRKNQQQGYSFRGIDEVLNALNPLISTAGLCILPRIMERVEEERQTKSGGALFAVTVRAEFDFVSVKDGTKHTVTMYGEGMDSADKATNKAMSAAYKYACFQVFCIPTEGMEDADAHTPEPAPRQQAKPQRQPVPMPQAQPEMLPADGRLLSAEEFRQANRTVKLDAFERIREQIGDDQYYRVLGVMGVEQATQFRSVGDAVKAYTEMLETFSALVRPAV